MDNFKIIRWKQRFENFKKSFHLLERTMSIAEPSEAERGGLIQFYEITFELGWKTLKDYLESEGFLVKTPRDVIKQAFQIDLIEDGENWLEALNDRNLTVHVYDEAIMLRVESDIRTTYFPLLKVLYNQLLKMQ
ncbi:nucleotidyltransferase substrate binding protein [bacterium]|nr:nucleotidyltransferase substrate binding protein [bacterium]